jgi:anti-sigma factor RsiW
MKDEILTDTLLRQYLLGKVDDDERQRIEKLFITDSQARDRVLAAEQDLIEAYLEDSLTTEDKEIFLSHYAETPDQQRKLRITKSIKDWAVTEAQAVPNSSSFWSFLEPLRLRPAFVVPVAVAVLIAIVVASVWFSRSREHWAIQKEVAQLNTPESLSQTPSDMISLRLTPVAVRSGKAQNQLTKRADTQIVELQLLGIDRERYPSYRASVSRVEGKKPIVTFDIKPEDNNAVRLRLSASRLDKGSYVIELSGIAADGSVGPTEEYTFTVDQ